MVKRSMETYKTFLSEHGGFLKLADIIQPRWQYLQECIYEYTQDTLNNLNSQFKQNSEFYFTKCKDEFEYLYKSVRLYIITSILSSLYHELDRNKKSINMRRYVLDSIMQVINKHYMNKECIYDNEKHLDIHEMWYCVEKFLEHYNSDDFDGEFIPSQDDKFRYHIVKSNKNFRIRMYDFSRKVVDTNKPLWEFSVEEHTVCGDKNINIRYSTFKDDDDLMKVEICKLDDDKYGVLYTLNGIDLTPVNVEIKKLIVGNNSNVNIKEMI